MSSTNSPPTLVPAGVLGLAEAEEREGRLEKADRQCARAASLAESEHDLRTLAIDLKKLAVVAHHRANRICGRDVGAVVVGGREIGAVDLDGELPVVQRHADLEPGGGRPMDEPSAPQH